MILTGIRQSEDTDLLVCFSQTVLELYRLAREEPLERFHQTMMECIQALIPFDAAWWGRSAVTLDGPDYLHSSYFYHLPDHYFDSWQKIRDRDTTIDRVFNQPQRAVQLDMSDASVSDELKNLAKDYGFDYLACVMLNEGVAANNNHLSLYRSLNSGPFTSKELTLMEILIPHMVSATVNNNIRNVNVVSMMHSAGQQYALAVSNTDGLLHSAEPGLVSLFNIEWPEWHGPRLPFPIEKSDFSKTIRGKHISVDIRLGDKSYLIMARLLSAIENLTDRELDVARQFGEGKTYSKIAEDIGISPHTVRYYIRSIYNKLNVNNKADLVRMIHTGS